MTRQYFGTDGIRGRANTAPMTADIAMKVAMATACVLRKKRSGNYTDRVVIGKDTRLSGYMFEEAMAAGFVAMGMEVILTGPIPTPAIAMLTRSLRADVGVMISASHNPFQDNGIKLFGADGYKLDDEIEREIESKIEADLTEVLASPENLGKASRLDDAPGRYIEYIKSSFPKGETLEGLKIVIDCAHGAAYKVAPQVLWELEAEVITIGNAPNGRNINDCYGATALENLQRAVKENQADIGIALDGDADRVIFVDETGAIVDGDQLMCALALAMKERDILKEDVVVATVMSNLGMERRLAEQGIRLIRTKVGDRYVVEEMRKNGYALGGEQSGHIILSSFGTTGDGLLAALQILALLKSQKQPASKALRAFNPYPQILKNVGFKGHPGVTPLENEKVKDAIKKAEMVLAHDGRVLVRASGTEPVIRVMVEGQNQEDIETAANDICSVIENVSTPV